MLIRFMGSGIDFVGARTNSRFFFAVFSGLIIVAFTRYDGTPHYLIVFG